MIRISVVIPTLDRPGPLTACLSALAVEFPVDAETIVVADGGRHDLDSVVAPFVEPLRLRLLKTVNGGPAAARNRGLAIARGEIVAFTDDDCRPQPGWLTALAAGVAAMPPRAVGGTTHNGLPGNVYADAAELVLNLLARHDRDLVRRERLLPSNNFAFPTDPLRKLGGFDERFRTAEDRELCRRWAKRATRWTGFPPPSSSTIRGSISSGSSESSSSTVEAPRSFTARAGRVSARARGSMSGCRSC